MCASGRGELDVKSHLTTVSVRCDQKILHKLDEWRRAQGGTPTRAAAIRRLVEQALAGTTAARRHSSGSKRKAADMASRELNYLGDQTATGEERARRKHRLIKGPGEFRDIRRDQPKQK